MTLQTWRFGLCMVANIGLNDDDDDDVRHVHEDMMSYDVLSLAYRYQ
jgi:hypothetical protein